MASSFRRRPEYSHHAESRQMKLRPILLEILQTQFEAVADEMAITLARTARSTYVKDAADFSTGLADRTGKFFAYPATMGVAGFIDLNCGVAIESVSNLEPGDVIITNHPYFSGGLSTHMPDIQLIKPYFHGDELVCYGWDFIHSADIGGGVPSSISPGFTELYQEGFQIPPLKLFKGGELNQDFEVLYKANCRTPDLNFGDIKAMLAALTVGERRISELIDRYGLDTFLQAQIDLVEYGQKKAKAVQRKIPDGNYVFWDYMDDDFATKIPVRIRCELTVDDGLIHLDFSGSDPQVTTAYNVPTGGVRHPWLTLKLMHLIGTFDKTIPLNYGLFENITVKVPKGTILNPEFPASVGVRHATAVRINDTIVGALAKALPGLTPAPSGGTVVPIVVAEQNEGSENTSIMVVQTLVGGTGAREGADGVDGRDSGLANLYNTPLERAEADSSVVIESYALRPDSGGVGKWRGGAGLEMTILITKSGTAILGRGLERFVFRPWGVAGGQAGARCRVILNKGTQDERDLGKIEVFVAEKGDKITVLTAGGGGYGNGFERPPHDVLRDVKSGYVTKEAAKRDYGVVIRDGNFDVKKTESFRNKKSEHTSGFGFGPERTIWESVFDDARMCELSELLLALPAGQRSQEKRRIISAVVPKIEDKVTKEISDTINAPSEMKKQLDKELANLRQKLS